ncbi:hypothetical protein N7471_012934 [Penicillium samsonianum]|uniref:uncharacterized protein n=1 Tax=Penicillium samsonianum TaxID=1882272 RepID=UPI0025483749|nr:uncharacterized protein N7471_012934 [Penicillium samsonianum]KAJ6125617.1 hypothetical protein N7471_012934 [Penicillium samsonianum]
MSRQNILVQPTVQQLVTRPEDDWTGKADPKERKRLQDRINQRNLRQRKKAGYSHPECDLHSPRDLSNANEVPYEPLGEQNILPPHHGHHLATCSCQPKFLNIDSFTACEPDSEKTEQFILGYSNWMHGEYLKGSPRAETLLSLVQFNMTRALVANAKTLGLTTRLMSRQARSHFASAGVETTFIDSLPPSLQPTIFQLTIPHHPWIDLLPVPELRDNLLHRSPDLYDAAQLCRDMRGFQQVTGGRGGVAVWGQSWDPHGWEISPAFAQKWPWVVQNCHSLLESTNHWRRTRGEAPLRVWHDTSITQNGPSRVQEAVEQER